MARPGHTADPAGPTHQYMLGGSRDIPAINPQGSCSPKSVPAVVRAAAAAAAAAAREMD